MTDHHKETTKFTVDDAYKHLSLIPSPDGSLTRLNQPPNQPVDPDLDYPLSKDVPLNPNVNTSIRLFRPPAAVTANGAKLPLILYFHGGGFILLSSATFFFDKSCRRVAGHVPAIVASVDYRLAPEHRLPAAYDDAMDAVMWVKDAAVAAAGGGSGGEPWLTELVDFSRVFLMGSSAGGNIVYHTALRALDLDISPIKIVGLLLNEAYFSGVERTESEVKHADDPLIPMHVSDLMWQLALPKGADRGHVYGDLEKTVRDERIRRLPPSMVRGYAGDPLVDRERMLAKILEENGVEVWRRFGDGGRHAIDLFEEEYAAKMYADVRDFVLSVGK